MQPHCQGAALLACLSVLHQLTAWGILQVTKKSWDHLNLKRDDTEREVSYADMLVQVVWGECRVPAWQLRSVLHPELSARHCGPGA